LSFCYNTRKYKNTY